MIPDWRAAVSVANACLAEGGVLAVADFTTAQSSSKLHQRLLTYVAMDGRYGHFSTKCGTRVRVRAELSNALIVLCTVSDSPPNPLNVHFLLAGTRPQVHV
jgi:hypothetical protein